MKKYSFLFILAFMLSCNIDVPECNDSLVKEKVVEMFNKKIKEDLIGEYIIEKIGDENIKAYARDKWMSVEEVIETEKNNLSVDDHKYIDEILSNNSLIGIRTQKIEKEIKKCTCSGEIINDKNLMNKTNIGYSVHAIEDDIGRAYFNVWFE